MERRPFLQRLALAIPMAAISIDLLFKTPELDQPFDLKTKTFSYYIDVDIGSGESWGANRGVIWVNSDNKELREFRMGKWEIVSVRV